MIFNSTFKQIDKETFAKFKKVRHVLNPLLGDHLLKVKQNVKYLVKCLPSYLQFYSYRSRSSPLHRYIETSNTFYVYPLLGQSLFQMMKYFNPLSEHKNKITSKQFQAWYEKNHFSFENCLREILNVLLKAIQDGVKQILLECLRIYNGEVLYCYQTWMNSSFYIVQNSPTQIQNYFFSEEDLKQLESTKEKDSSLVLDNYSLNSLFFRTFLLVLSYGSNSLKVRNYQYGKFSLNRQNLKRRIEYFKMNYNNKKLGDLIERIINGQQILMEELCKLTNQSPSNLITSIYTNSQNALNQICPNKNFQSHEKLLLQSNSSQSLNINQTFNSRITINTKPSVSKLSIQSKQNKENMRKSLYQENIGSDSFISVNSKQQKNSNCKAQVRVKLKQNNKKYNLSKNQSFVVCQSSFNIKQQLSKQQESSFYGNIKILRYLGLQEYLPNCTYQKNILEYLDNIYIKDNFIKINYPNGSLYFGEVNAKNERHGTGLYMFSSNDIYFGEWFKNQMSGQGRYIFRSGQVYVGTVKNGNKNGYGKFIYSDQKVYEGYWNNNQKCGLSIMTFPNKIKFFGQFHANQNEVEGVFIGFDQNENILWKKNAFLNSYDCVKNKFKNENQQNTSQHKKLLKISTSNFAKKSDNEGNNFIGSMKNNIKNGYGILQTQKCIYKGMFKNNQRDGQGELISKQQGFLIKGQWKEGMLVHYQLDL